MAGTGTHRLSDPSGPAAASPAPAVLLWVKSNYSFLEAASDPEELVLAAAEAGYTALAITDRDSVGGIVRAMAAATEAGITLIVGAQISVTDGSQVLALCLDRCGYANLCQMISAGRLRNPKGSCSVHWHEVLAFSEGLEMVVLRFGEQANRHELCRELAATLGRRIRIGIARHFSPESSVREQELAALAAESGIRCVATPEVLYHQADRRDLHDVMTAIRHRCSLDELGTELRPNASHALPTPAELAGRYADHPDWLAEAGHLAQRCRFRVQEIRYRYPAESVPDGFTTMSWLRHLTQDGARFRYDGTIPADVQRQLNHELEVIQELDYAGYFLTMWEIVSWCRRQEILCQGRGSAANSAVCFCLGITAVDPVRMNLLFERFLSRERAEPPDIDLDIEHQRREEVIQHMYERYGRDRAAMVANVIRYRPRSAVRDVGRALGLPLTSVDRIARQLGYRGGDLAQAVAAAGLDPMNPRMQLLLRLSTEILDAPRHLSIHPGGFLLGSEPVTHLVPVENATMPGRTVIQWDKYDVEALGLFKVDLLGLGALTHLRKSFGLLSRHLGRNIRMAAVPADDPAVYAMLARADTVGVFQIESRAQMAMLPRLKPREFYDLVIEISIVRPGPISGGMVHPYLRRRSGEEPITYPHPSLEPVLQRTCGVPLFQEQVMKLAVVAADYTPGEADQLRRDMAAWRRSGRIEKHRQKLVERMMAKGIAEQFAQQVFEQIRGFGEYGFPESHAASFALIAYCTAWLRCHYPAAFTCGLLNAWPMGFYAPSSIVEDARRHGIVVRPIDVNLSDWECELEEIGELDARTRGRRRRSAMTYRDGGLGVRMGLRFIRGLSEESGRRIVALRDSPYRSVEDLVDRLRIPRDELEMLAAGGALRSLGIERREALWAVLGRPRESREPGLSPAAGAGGQDPFEEVLPAFPGIDLLRTISWDYETAGHSTLGHPMEAFREPLRKGRFSDAQTLARQTDGSSARYCGMVICRQMPETAGGTVFMTLEDESGFVNLVIWQDFFAEHRSVLITASILAVEGTLQSRDGTVHVVVRKCWSPALEGGVATPASRDFH